MGNKTIEIHEETFYKMCEAVKQACALCGQIAGRIDYERDYRAEQRQQFVVIELPKKVPKKSKTSDQKQSKNLQT